MNSFHCSYMPKIPFSYDEDHKLNEQRPVIKDSKLQWLEYGMTCLPWLMRTHFGVSKIFFWWLKKKK